MLKKVTTCAITLIIFINVINSQELRTIETAVPCLTIAPNSRAGAMGDVGAATEPDINSMHWNPAKYAFIENQGGISVSYTPWLRNLVNDIDLGYVAGYYRINKQQVIAASLLYFSMGQIDFRDIRGEYIKSARPNEFAIDAAYALQFSEKVSGGMAFRFINSDLSSGVSSTGVDTKPGRAFAADISVYYRNNTKISDKDGNYSFGLDISNIGNRISYTDDTKNKDFIPINMRLGGALMVNVDNYNSFAMALDLNKMLVPTRPIYQTTVDGGDTTDANGNHIIKYGKDPNVSVVTGMIQSFYDAPGVVDKNGHRSVLKEELQEITYSVGLEYWYRKQFALRAGYFYENPNKGNRKYFTVGLGFHLNVFGLDFSYLIPTYANNPLANTLRFSLLFDFGSAKKPKKE